MGTDGHRPGRWAMGAALVFVAIGAGCCPPPPVGIRVLMVAEAAPSAEPDDRMIWAQRLRQRGNMTVEVAGDASALQPADLIGRDVFLLYGCEPLRLSPSTREAMIERVRAGAGLVAVHGALGSPEGCPRWAERVGVTTAGHAGAGRREMIVVDPQHAIMMGMGRRFELVDDPVRVEPYTPGPGKPSDAPAAGTAGTQAKGDKWKGSDDAATGLEVLVFGAEADRPPRIWTRPYGQGRVFASTLGHERRLLADEWYLTLLHSGIRWAGHDLPETPHNALSLAEQQEGYVLLFNGRDLAGWAGDAARWTVIDGEMVAATDAPASEARLATAGEYGEFDLRFAVRLDAGGARLQFGDGYQLALDAQRFGTLAGGKVDEAAANPGSGDIQRPARRPAATGWALRPDGTGSLPRPVAAGSASRPAGTGSAPPQADAGRESAVSLGVYHPDGWNDVRLRVEPGRVLVRVNGFTTAEQQITEAASAVGSGALIFVLDPQGQPRVRLRDIRIQRLGR